MTDPKIRLPVAAVLARKLVQRARWTVPSWRAVGVVAGERLARGAGLAGRRGLDFAGGRYRLNRGRARGRVRATLAVLRRAQIRIGGAADAVGGRIQNTLTHVVVVEVEFTEWTSDGRLRHPSFKGVREDKPAHEVMIEIPKVEG